MLPSLEIQTTPYGEDAETSIRSSLESAFIVLGFILNPGDSSFSHYWLRFVSNLINAWRLLSLSTHRKMEDEVLMMSQIEYRGCKGLNERSETSDERVSL